MTHIFSNQLMLKLIYYVKSYFINNLVATSQRRVVVVVPFYRLLMTLMNKTITL